MTAAAEVSAETKAGRAVVVGVQDPESGRPVIAQGIDLAGCLGGELIVAHVEDFPRPARTGHPAPGLEGPPVVPVAEVTEQRVEGDPVAEEDAWLPALGAQVAAELGLEGVPRTYRRAHGDPGRVLTELAAETDAYCVIVGSRGEGVWDALTRMVRPSVSRSVIRDRSVPVLVVPQASADDESNPMG